VLGPLVWHLGAPQVVGPTLSAAYDAGWIGAVDYARQFVPAATPRRAWVLLPYVALLGMVLAGALERRRVVLARHARRLAPRAVELAGRHGRAARLLLGLFLVTVATACAAAGAKRGWWQARDAWAREAAAHRQERQLFEEIRAGRPRIDRLRLAARPDLRVVLYLGESTTKWNWSLYGYPRLTNAPLAAHAASGRLLWLSDAVVPDAPPGAPAEGLAALRFLYQRNGDGLVALTHVLAAAGVPTTWLANPAKQWAYDSAITGDPRPGTPRAGSGRFYDDALLPQLRSELARPGGARFLVLDTYAGHFAYCANVPARKIVQWDDWMSRLNDVAIWGRSRSDRGALDCYDSAMRYASENIRQALLAADASPKPILFIYVPDHGEDVWRQMSPYSAERSMQQREVPVLLYFNREYAHRYPRLIINARANRDRAFSTAWLYDGILDAFGVTGDSASILYDSRRSIFASAFDPDSGYALGDRAERHPDEVRQVRRRYGAGSSLCGHRANSLFKYLQAKALLGCTEVDVVLQDTRAGPRAFVFHPTTRNTGLDLYELIRHAGVPASGMWLDVKNLTEQDAPVLLQRLGTVIPPGRRSRILIETDNGSLVRSPAARAVADSGYVLSYYLPTDTLVACSRVFDPRCEDLSRQMARGLDGGAFGSLSFDARGAAMAGEIRARMASHPMLNTWAFPGDWPTAPGDLALLGRVGKYLVELGAGFDY
jgi:hypothetical protein